MGNITRMLKPKLLLCLLIALIVAPVAALAAEPEVTEAKPEFVQRLGGNPGPFLFAEGAGLTHAFRFDVTGGRFNDARTGVGFAGSIGAAFAFPFYDPSPEYELHIDMGLGGFVTDDDANVGPGNLSGGIKWIFWRGAGHSLATGIDAMLPFAQSEANAGLSTPGFIHYFEDAFGFTPAIYYSYEQGHLALAAHAEIDILLIIDDTASPVNTNDAGEFFLNHSAAVAYIFGKSFRVTAEGYASHSLTGESVQSEIWVGPGLIWSGPVCSLKGGVELPVSGDAQDVMTPLVRLAWNYRF